MKPVWFVALLIGFWCYSGVSAQANHLHYYESSYTFLGNTSFQLYSFAPLQGDLVTVVVYGINPDVGVLPIISVFDPDFALLTEDLNADGDSVASVQFRAPANGLYIIAVSRLGEVAGAVRVMLFEGEALDQDISLLDTGSPLLPDRAFLVAGDSPEPLELSTYVLEDETLIPQHVFFAARGDEQSPPPPIERQTPVEERRWENANPEIFYTLNVASNTEIDPQRPTVNLSAERDESFYDFIVQIGAGSAVPVRVNRSICFQRAEASPTYAAPDQNAFITGYIPNNTLVEVIATDSSSEWVQIVQPDRPSGYSWLPLPSNFDLDSSSCERVEVNSTSQASWATVANNYRRLQQLVERNRQGVVISLGFSCGDKNPFRIAYQALQNRLGALLPSLELVLDTLGSISCRGSAASPASGGDGSVIMLNERGQPQFGASRESVIESTPACTTTTLVGSPAGGVANHFMDNFTGGNACDVVLGNNVANLLQGMGGDDTLQGYGGNDTLQGGDGNDAINAGAGDDVISGGTGNDVMDGDAGNDTYDASDLGGNQNIDLSTGFALVGGDVDILANIENVQSGAGNDNLRGSFGNNQLAGGDGDDTLRGGGGNDLLLGEGGNDELLIEGGMGNSTLDSGTGNNRFRVRNGATGNVTLTSGGNDTLDFSEWGNPITFDMGNITTPQNIGGSLFLRLTNAIQNLIGTAFGDDLTGSTGNNSIYAGEGDDTVDGNNGNDWIHGDSGADSLLGGNGIDTLYGGWFNDGVNRDDNLGVDTLDGGAGDLDQVVGGNYNINGGSGDDGADSITDASGNEDWLIGGNVNQNGSGDDGDDTFIDYAGNEDTIYGGNLNIMGTGNDGNDLITDQAGNSDYLYGGNRNEPSSSGNDGADTLTDQGGIDDQIYGGNRNQAGSSGNDGADSIRNQGAGGNDNLFGGNYNETGTGSDGNDTILEQGSGANNNIHGGNRNLGGAGNDGNDSIVDSQGNNDAVYGGNQNDGGTGNDNQAGGGDTISTADGQSDVLNGGNQNIAGGSGTDGNSDSCTSNGGDAVSGCP